MLYTHSHETPSKAETQVPSSKTRVTSERFINHVAKALGRQWFDSPALQTDDISSNKYAAGICDEFRQDSETAILAYLSVLEEQGYCIVRADEVRN